MKTFLASIAAAGVLVAGAFVASAVTDAPASAQIPVTDVASDEERVGPLQEILDELVADGTLTQAQADEVQTRLEDAYEDIRERRQDRRQDRRADRQQIGEFLEDDVIDSGELAELGDDHPFNDPDGPFADAAADGQITREELESLREERSEHRDERHASWQQIGEFLEDDVIDSGELAELGDDHPFNDPDGPFADAAADGQITREELEEAKGSFRGHRGPRGHGGWGSGASAGTVEDAGFNA